MACFAADGRLNRIHVRFGRLLVAGTVVREERREQDEFRRFRVCLDLYVE